MKFAVALALACFLMACDGSASHTPGQKDAVQAASEAMAAATDDLTFDQRNSTLSRAMLKGCAIAAISIETDPAGLNIRSGPTEDSPVIGVLHSLIPTDPHALDDPPAPGDRAFGPAFTITAISGPWLRITDIDPETEGWDRATRKRDTKRNFQGSGWVHSSRVAIDPGFHNRAYDRPYFEHGNWTSIDDQAGERLTLTGGKQGYSAEFIACQRDWIKLGYSKADPDGSDRPATGWFHMRPHYVGPDNCTADDVDCTLRQQLGLWDGGG